MIWHQAWLTFKYFANILEKVNDKAAAKSLLEAGLKIAEEAISLNDQLYPVHKWYAILLSGMVWAVLLVSQYEWLCQGEHSGSKEKIQNAYKIKEHALKANELHPNDPTTLHLLGRCAAHFIFVLIFVADGALELLILDGLSASLPVHCLLNHRSPLSRRRSTFSCKHTRCSHTFRAISRSSQIHICRYEKQM